MVLRRRGDGTGGNGAEPRGIDAGSSLKTGAGCAPSIEAMLRGGNPPCGTGPLSSVGTELALTSLRLRASMNEVTLDTNTSLPTGAGISNSSCGGSLTSLCMPSFSAARPWPDHLLMPTVDAGSLWPESSSAPSLRSTCEFWEVMPSM